MTAETAQIAEQLVVTVTACGGAPELAELIRESINLAYATGMRDGVREVQAVVHTQNAMARMRREPAR